MGVGQSFKLAIKSLLLSKMRSLLTMLGIIIGVGAVIIIISLGDGLQRYIKQEFEGMGSNLVIAQIFAPSTTRTVDPDQMYDLVTQYSDTLTAVTPEISVNATLKVGTETYTTGISGVGESANIIRSLTISEGRFLSYVDVMRYQNVCVVGSYVASDILEGNAIGKQLNIGGIAYTVIGVVKEKAGSSQGGEDDKVYIPYTNATRINGDSTIRVYYFSAVNGEAAAKGKWAVENELKSFFKDDDDYYSVMNMSEVLAMMDSVYGMLMSVLVAIAGISLLVGGIGIMNIMLVSVTERTKEIGIRKSLGAKRRDIRLQFIIEAGTTSAIGGIFGIALGVSAAKLVGTLVNIDATPSISAVAISVGVSVAIGVLFGYLPANKAAKLNPIDALRFE